MQVLLSRLIAVLVIVFLVGISIEVAGLAIGNAFASAPIESAQPNLGIFSKLILAFNFLSLAGIVIGAILRSKEARDALEIGYIELSDVSRTGVDKRQIVQLIDSAITAVVLSPRRSLSVKKIAFLSFLASFVLGSSAL